MFITRQYDLMLTDSEDDKLSWMEVINAAIESDAGELGERFEKNRMSVRQRLSRRVSLHIYNLQNKL